MYLTNDLLKPLVNALTKTMILEKLNYDDINQPWIYLQDISEL